MSLSVLFLFIAAYLFVRTCEKVFAIWYTIVADRALKRAEKEALAQRRDAVKVLEDLVNSGKAKVEDAGWTN